MCIEAKQNTSKIKKNQQQPSLLDQNSSNFFTNKKTQNSLASIVGVNFHIIRGYVGTTKAVK